MTHTERVNVIGPPVPGHTIMPPPEPTYSSLTPRQYAAIQLRVPNSGTDWLDAMILQSLRNEMAAKAMPWVASTFTQGKVEFYDRVAESSYRLADAMIKARKAE